MTLLPTKSGTAEGIRLREPANLVSPRAKRYWTVRALVGWLVVCSAITLPLILADPGPMAAVALGIAIVLGATHVLVMPQWRYRVHRWEITPSAVYTRTGWLNQKRRIAALSRIQTVDTERGPIEQLFKLANVTVTTASAAGPLRIHGLELKTADQLVEALTAATGRNTGDAT